MNWHETIDFIRSQPEYDWLVKNAYFDKDLVANVIRFSESEEFSETLRIIKNLFGTSKISVLDVGSGNGISAVAFAIAGHQVSVIEPDPSNTVGVGAIQFLKEHYKLDNLQIHQTTAEDATLPKSSFDLVYVRQALHHAYDLNQFVLQTSSFLKTNAYFLSVRDHYIYDETDKKIFLEAHPLHKFYGGENAFTLKEYRSAIEKANLKIISFMDHYDSVINYAPAKTEDIKKLDETRKISIRQNLTKKVPFITSNNTLYNVFFFVYKFKLADSYDASQIPGRNCSFLAQKTI